MFLKKDINSPARRSTGIPILLLVGLIVFFTSSIHWLAFSQQSIKEGVDLQKGWRVCFGNEFEYAQEECGSYVVDLPDNGQTHHPNDITNHISYRNKFITPTFCSDPDRNGCVFYVGGAYQGIELTLNGHPLGRHFSKSDLYPASYPLPQKILKSDGTPNDIRLFVYTQPGAHKPTISQGPIGIVSLQESHTIDYKIVGERVVLPLINAAIELTLALIALFWILSKNSSQKILVRYFFFCVAASLYMLSATRIPREFLGYSTGVSLNYALRYLMDFSIFELVVACFSVTISRAWILRYLYYFAVLTFIVIIILDKLSPSSRDTFTTINLKLVSLGALRRGNFAYYLACLFTPLMLLGPILGLHQSFKFRLQTRGALAAFVLFLVLVPMQVSDILTLFGLIRVNHEIYYMRLYTPFIGIVFGYMIWMTWIENEHVAEATLRVGTVAQAAAHDLRSPLFALKALSKNCINLSTDDKELLSSVIVSVDKITSKLLEMYRTSPRPTSEVDDIEIFETHNIGFVIQEFLRRKNYVLSDAGKVLIKTDFDPQSKTEIFCSLSLADFYRALDNVINNALDASRENSTHSVLVRLQNKKNLMEIDVIDNGKGADEHSLRLLNSKQFKKTTKSYGHGLGLQEAWRIIQLHHGNLVFENRPEGGFIARITLPIATPK